MDTAGLVHFTIFFILHVSHCCTGWRNEQESLLRRYLRENLVTPSLTARIHNCLNKAMKLGSHQDMLLGADCHSVITTEVPTFGVL